VWLLVLARKKKRKKLLEILTKGRVLILLENLEGADDG
jgi:hypothetical protein